MTAVVPARSQRQHPSVILQERRQKGKEQFKNLLGNNPEITDKLTKEIIHDQLDTNYCYITEDELDRFLKRIKSKKTTGLDKIPFEARKTKKFDDILRRLCEAVYNQS